MIKVVMDDKSFTVDTVDELQEHLEEIFPADPRSGVMVTYVVTTQPTSRRMA